MRLTGLRKLETRGTIHKLIKIKDSTGPWMLKLVKKIKNFIDYLGSTILNFLDFNGKQKLLCCKKIYICINELFIYIYCTTYHKLILIVTLLYTMLIFFYFSYI